VNYFDITCPVVEKRWLGFHGMTSYAPSPVLVTHQSPAPLRRRVEVLARYFRREFRYDFVNYSASDGPDCEAWLWTSCAEGRLYATGHAVFWRLHYIDRPGPEWELGSVWHTRSSADVGGSLTCGFAGRLGTHRFGSQRRGVSPCASS
jgi:hypothetical protein